MGNIPKENDNKLWGKIDSSKPWQRVFIIGILVCIVIIFTANLEPFRAFGGAIWLKGGIHYMSNEEISNRINQLDTPKELKIADDIKNSTPNCENIDEGFCKNSNDNYAYKTLESQAIEYKPAVPDRQVITGYCTLCNDGTRSPSCSTGRGTCSWHNGIEESNAPIYKTIYGTPAIQARPAVYSYSLKSYKDSPQYISPVEPTLSTIVGY